MDNGKLKIGIVQFLIEDYGNNYSSNVKKSFINNILGDLYCVHRHGLHSENRFVKYHFV